MLKSWIDTILSFLKEFLAPILAYFKGRADEKNSDLKKQNEKLRKENKILRDDAGTSDNVLSFKLRERARRKRKD